MTDYAEGDLVEAVREEALGVSRFRGIVRMNEKLGWLYLDAPNMAPPLPSLEAYGFTITVIDRAGRPLTLPDAPYTAILATFEPTVQRRILFLYGEVWIDGNGGVWSDSDITDFETKTVPLGVVRDVLRDVRNAVVSGELGGKLSFGGAQFMHTTVDRLRSEYGVTE